MSENVPDAVNDALSVERLNALIRRVRDDAGVTQFDAERIGNAILELIDARIDASIEKLKGGIADGYVPVTRIRPD